MITINYGHLVDGNFAKGLSKLSMWTEGKTKTRMHIGKLTQQYAKKANAVTVSLNAVIDTHCEKTDDGKRKAVEGTEGTYIIPDANIVAWEKDLDQVAMELDCRQIAFS